MKINWYKGLLSTKSNSRRYLLRASAAFLTWSTSPYSSPSNSALQWLAILMCIVEVLGSNLDPQIQKTNVLSLFCKQPSDVSQTKLPTGCDKLLLGQGYHEITDNCTAKEEWRRGRENRRRSEKKPTKVSFRPSRILHKEIRDRTRGSVITKHRSLVWDKARQRQPIAF